MSKLLNLENKFQNYLLKSDQDILQHITSTEKVSADIRLSIYANAYRSRLCEALATSYPILERYLGSEEFEELCFSYINSYPSCYRSIRWFGDQLAEFLNNHSHYMAFPFLSELAKLEWTMALVFDAADSNILLLDDMGKIPPEEWINMRFQWHPSVYRLSLSWNVVQIWQAITDDQIPPEPQQSSVPIPWLLWRFELMSQFSSLSEDEAWAIDKMRDELTFGELCEGLCAWVNEDNAGMHAASLLKGWITAGLIISVKITQEVI